MVGGNEALSGGVREEEQRGHTAQTGALWVGFKLPQKPVKLELSKMPSFSTVVWSEGAARLWLLGATACRTGVT